MAVRVQTEDFDVGAESRALQAETVGGIALFVGTVRGLSSDDGVTAMTLEDVADMKECFLTGTAAEVTPVSKIGDRIFTPGDASRQLVEGYEDLVRGRISV